MPDPDALAQFVGAVSSLIDQVGTSGIPLSELDGGHGATTPAQRSVREQLLASSLARVDNGTLVLTGIGVALAALPDAARADKLWRHLAATLGNVRHEISSDAIVLLLLIIAADRYDFDYQEGIAAGLAALGWRTTEGELLDRWDAFEAVVAQYRFLSHAGAFTSGEGSASATPVGVDFARTALRVEAAQS